jgi:magnesium chelatase subunit D
MTHHNVKIYFPFSAIVGLDDAKLALMVNAVNPLIEDVVLASDKGTDKSTLVRAFAQVLPEQPVARGCSFNCNPFNPLEMCDYHYGLWSKGNRIEYEYRKRFLS